MELPASKRWHRVEALFAASLELSADERRAYLDTTCGDSSIRAEVARLLTAHDNADGFLRALPPERVAALIEAVDGPLAEGARVGTYCLVRELGRGGMGRVYLAEDTILDRFVALKFLPPHLSTNERAKKRLIDEAKAASAIDHPNIAVVHDIGETSDGQVFIAMAYYDGETLREKLDGGPIYIGHALELFEQVVAALAAAHARGIAHRDVKPENVIVLPAQRIPGASEIVKLVDFGIAKARSAARTDGIRGTIAYMSPEQTQGDGGGARSDVWSLGVMLYEMLSGDRPFVAESHESFIDAIQFAQPLPLPQEVPRSVEKIVSRCLEKDPASRYEDAGDLLHDLHALHVDSGWKRRGLAIAAVVLLAVLAAGLLLRQEGTNDFAVETRLAVLPLDDLSADREDAYFAEGLTEEIVSRLSRLEDLRIVGRTSAAAYRDTDLTHAEIGRELRAATILEGSVRKADERARIVLRLVDAESEDVLWSDSYEVGMSDVIAVQGEVAEQVASALQLQTSKLFVRSSTEHPEAYEHYLRGRYFWNKRSTDGIQRAKASFEAALDIDPTYAKAWAGLADVYNTWAGYGLGTAADAYPRARAAAERALSIDPSLAEAHTALAAVLSDYYWQSDEAEHHFRRAIDLNPNHAVALYWFSEFLANRGRFEEALVMAQRAQEVDPFSLIAHADEGRVYYLSRQYDRAIGHFKTTLKLGPQFVSYLYLGLSYAAKGSYTEATDVLEEALARYPFHDVQALLAYTYARAGRRDEAEKILEELLALRKQEYVEAAVIASVYVGLGNTAEALDWLERGYADRNWQMTFLATEPVFDPLRSEPRFQALTRRIASSD